MMRFREIRTSERITEQEKKDRELIENLKKFHSESGITIEEAKQYWWDLFHEMQEAGV